MAEVRLRGLWLGTPTYSSMASDVALREGEIFEVCHGQRSYAARVVLPEGMSCESSLDQVEALYIVFKPLSVNCRLREVSRAA